MPGVTRLGDPCTGHGCYSSRPNISASPDVTADGIPVHRVSDAWAVHCCIPPDCHGGTTIIGSGTVFANGKQVARVGDNVDCGSQIAMGSFVVFAGD